MRFLFNISIILIICFSATILPFNDSFYSSNMKIFDLKLFDKKSVEVVATPSSYSTNVSNLIFNPSQIEFTMFSDFDKVPFKIGDDHDLILRVYDYNDSIINTYKNLEIISEIDTHTDVNTQLSYILNIAKDNLNLPLGDYIFKIQSSSDIFTTVDPVQFSVSYVEPIVYEPKALRALEDDEEIFTLYYPNSTKDYLVPVTRIVKKKTNPYRGVADSLLEPPANSMISSEVPIPAISKLWSRNGVLYIHLPTNIGEFNQNKDKGAVALNTILKTFDNFDDVDSIQILRGDKYVSNYLAGNNVRYPIEVFNTPKYYLPKLVDGQVMFIPRDISAEFEVKMNYVDFIFDNLKNLSEEGFVRVIPSYASLNSATLDDGILTVDFNEGFLNLHNGDKNMQQLTLDTLLYSFSSISNIKSIKINIDGNESAMLGDIDLSKPLNQPSTINIIE